MSEINKNQEPTLEQQNPALMKIIDTVKALPDPEMERVWHHMQQEILERNRKFMGGAPRVSTENLG